MRVHGQKTRQLSPKEFGENLKILLNKKLEAVDKSISIKAFVDQIDALKKK